MANLYEILANAEDGQAMAILGRELELTPEETEAAVIGAAARNLDRPQAIDGDT